MSVGIWNRVAAVPIVVLALGIAPAAAAQDAALESVSIDVALGIGGFVDPASPVAVTVTVSSVELFVGRIEVTSGGATGSTAIEVPAGGEKEFTLEGSAPGSRRNISVVLVEVAPDGTEERVATETQRVRVPREELLVGMLGIDGIDTALRSAESLPLARTVTPVAVTPDQIALSPDVLPYLVVGSDTLRRLDADALDVVDRWVRRGGRLIGPAAEVQAVSDPASGEVWPGTDAVVVRHGSGEVTALDPNAATVEDWGLLVRGTPPPGLVRNEALASQSFGLVSAASAGREAGVPALPWLLGGIVLFVALVGPVNFVILRRLGRPEAAWLTVPALSVVFVAGFWVLGRSQLSPFTVSQASVVIDVSGRIDGSGGFVLQVETGGEHAIALPEGWKSQPAAGFGGAVGRQAVTDDGRPAVFFDLDDLGVGTTQATWTQDDAMELDVTLTADGKSRDATVINSTPWEFWGWGVVVNGAGHTAAEPLMPGAEGTLTIRLSRARDIYEPVIAEAVNRRSFDIDGFQRGRFTLVSALAGYAEVQLSDLRGSGVYFFGFTDTPAPRISVDGKRTDAPGTTLVVKELDLAGADVVSLGAVRPELLEVTGASSVEGFYDEIYAYGANEVYFRYLVPEGAPGSGSINPGFTRLDTVDAYRWDTQEFETIEWGEPLDLAAYSSPGGDLVVRASSGDEFFDEALRLSRYELTWASA
ncbi:MAG: hypothetical protein ACE5GC_09005 [Acidimicrobiia bacterium]